jgi:hypothetical protein
MTQMGLARDSTDALEWAQNCSSETLLNIWNGPSIQMRDAAELLKWAQQETVLMFLNGPTEKCHWQP